MTDATDERPGADPAFLAFLHERLDEERVAARARAVDAVGAEQQRAERGLAFLEDVLAGLEAGRAPDRMSCDLLVVAYADHPAFRPAWNRWLRAAGTAYGDPSTSTR